MLASYQRSLRAAFTVVFCLALGFHVYDPSGAVVPNAKVQIQQPVSGYDGTTTTDSKRNFSFSNVPLNSYHMTVTAAGFAPRAQDVQIRSAVPTSVKVSLHSLQSKP
jgi:hypothetical protein